MDDDPVQFTFVVVIGELFRIGAYGIEADEEVTAKAVAFTVVKSDDICVNNRVADIGGSLRVSSRPSRKM